LTGQPILTYQELYEPIAKAERLKSELKALKLINQKSKGIERATPSECELEKTLSRSSKEPFCQLHKALWEMRKSKSRHPLCRVRINKCIWCGSPERLIAACPQRLKAVDKVAAKPLAPPPLPRLAVVGQAYVMSKEEATTSVTVVSGTHFLNSKPFYVLFDSGAIHSFISTRPAMQLNLEGMRMETNYRIKLLNDSVIKCPIPYKLVPITIDGTTFPVDLIQFDLSDSDIIFRMSWLHAYGAKIDCEDPKVILKVGEGREICFHGQRKEKSCPLISVIKASKLLC